MIHSPEETDAMEVESYDKICDEIISKCQFLIYRVRPVTCGEFDIDHRSHPSLLTFSPFHLSSFTLRNTDVSANEMLESKTTNQEPDFQSIFAQSSMTASGEKILSSSMQYTSDNLKVI